MPASAWAREKAESVCADSVWTDELVERMALALDEARAEEQRLRDRIKLMATHHEKSLTAYVAAQPRGEHRAIARAFRELLAEHDAAKEGDDA